MKQEYADRLFEARPHPKTHAIIAAMLGREPNTPQRFIGKATVTSDGFVMCDFDSPQSGRRMGAFVGSLDEIEENIQLVAEDLSIPEDETRELLRSWLGTDYRSTIWRA